MKLFKSMLFLMMCLTLTACTLDFDDPSDDNDDTNQQLIVSKRASDINLLGRASYHAFDEENDTKAVKSLKYNNLFEEEGTTDDTLAEDDELPLIYTYPYDYVKIDRAVKYFITLPESSDEALLPIISACGVGNLEVVIADFSVYAYEVDDEGNKNLDTLGLPFEETLISIRGSQGYYTILMNSASYYPEKTSVVFSSHKQLTSNEVVKDFEPPIYGIMFDTYSDGKGEISFTKANDPVSFEDFSDESMKYTFDATAKEEVSRDEMYSILDLTKLPEATITVKVVAVDITKGILEVESSSRLKYIIIDEYTVKSINISEELVGADLEITYDYYFDGYSPLIVYANSVAIL